MASRVVKVRPNKQIHLTWWVFLGGLTVYGFEIISGL